MVGHCAPQLQDVYNVEPDAVHAAYVRIREVLRLCGGRVADHRIDKQWTINILGESSKSYGKTQGDVVAVVNMDF